MSKSSPSWIPIHNVGPHRKFPGRIVLRSHRHIPWLKRESSEQKWIQKVKTSQNLSPVASCRISRWYSLFVEFSWNILVGFEVESYGVATHRCHLFGILGRTSISFYIICFCHLEEWSVISRSTRAQKLSSCHLISKMSQSWNQCTPVN